MKPILQQIVNDMQNWGYLLGDISKLPNPQTVGDIAMAINDLNQVQDELLRWLSRQASGRWAMLRAQIQSIKRAACWKEMRTAMSTYLALLSQEDNAPKRSERILNSLNRARIKAGDHMVSYADILEQAIENTDRASS